MTQLIVSIENPSMIADIRKAIKMIKGVVAVKSDRPKLNKATLAAIKDVEDGNTIHCGSFEDYKKLVSDL